MALLLIHKSLVQRLAFLILGILIGASGATALIGKHIDRLTFINQEQAEQLHDLERELSQVRESLSKHQAPVVSSLDVRITFEESKPTRLEENAIRLSLEKQIKELLQHLMGKKLEQLDPNLIRWIVENRSLEAEGHAFRITVRVLVLAEKVLMEVEAMSLPSEI